MTRFALAQAANAQAAEHAAAVARAIEGDNARACPVFIIGATGSFAAKINGFYAPTQEKGLDGRVLLNKRDDASMCMEHFGGHWQVKPVSNKGTDAVYAYVAGDCALQDCASRVWRVYDGKASSDQPSVKMATGSEAERQVSCGCMRAHGHDAPAPVSLAHARILACDALCFCTGR